MDASEEHLCRAVDEVLEPAWPAARRRASRRLVRSSFTRAAIGMIIILAFALVLRSVVGLQVPWVFFAFMGLLAFLAALPDSPARAHLQREPVPGAAPPAFRNYRR